MPSLKRTFWRRGIWAFLVAAAIVSALRCLWVASQLDVGMEMLAVECVEPFTADLEPRALSRLNLRFGIIDEVEFWRREAKRLTQLFPDDPEIAATAACLLDTQASYSRHAVEFELEDAIRLGELCDQCREESLAYGRAAVALQPHSVAWRRLLGSLLLSEYEFAPETFEAIVAELDECSAHDPDNAYYDYAIAAALFEKTLGSSMIATPGTRRCMSRTSCCSNVL